MAGRATIHDLEVFRAVCRTGGVSAAARDLRISQPSVSQTVKGLEEHFGVVLFDRIGRRMALTDEGRRLLERAERVLGAVEELEVDMSEGRGAHRLRVAASITTGTWYLPTAVARMSDELPDLTVTVRVADSGSVERAVVENEEDLGLIEGLVHHDALEARVFAHDRLVAIAAPGTAPPSLPAAALVRRPLILREPGSGVRELVDAALRGQGVVAEVTWESVSTGAIKAAVEAGLGMSIVPERLVARELAEGRLERVEVEGMELARDLTLIRRRDKHVSDAARALERILMSM